MAIRAIRARELRIPFKTSFKHASAERAETSSVWVEAESDAGLVGYGESCPRPYVTGETVESALAFIAANQAEWSHLDGLEAVRAWMGGHPDAIDRNPAAWCAMELALLDLCAKHAGATIEAILGVPRAAGPFRFSAVIGDEPPAAFAAMFQRYTLVGFRDFKIKLSGDLERDRAKIDVLRQASKPDLRVRADANNLWEDVAQATAFLRALVWPFFAIEEPIRANQYESLATIASALDCRIILDESLLRAGQIAELPGPPEGWIANVRVSKMGGLLRSLDLVQAATAAGIGVIVGAQVGETSVLTRAALTVATAAGAALLAQEGAFGTHLLQHDVCDRPLMFGLGGRLDPPAAVIDGPGFGLAITT